MRYVELLREITDTAFHSTRKLVKEVNHKLFNGDKNKKSGGDADPKIMRRAGERAVDC